MGICSGCRKEKASGRALEGCMHLVLCDYHVQPTCTLNSDVNGHSRRLYRRFLPTSIRLSTVAHLQHRLSQLAVTLSASNETMDSCPNTAGKQPLPPPCHGSVGGEKDRFGLVLDCKAATPLASSWTNQSLHGSDHDRPVARVGHDWGNLSDYPFYFS